MTIGKIIPVLLISVLSILNTKLVYSNHKMGYMDMDIGPAYTGNELFTYLDFKYNVPDKSNESTENWGITPGLGYSITAWFLMDIHLNLNKYGTAIITPKYQNNYPNGTSFLLESVSLYASISFAAEKIPVDLGLNLTYDIPMKRAERIIGLNHLFSLSIVLGETFKNDNNISANFKYTRDGKIDRFEWGTGAKYTIVKGKKALLQIAIESIGDFKGHWGMLPGIYVKGSEDDIIFRTGVFMGFSQFIDKLKNDGNKEEDLRVHLSITKKWNFDSSKIMNSDK